MTILHLLGLPPRIQSRYLSGIKQSTPDRILAAVTGYTGIYRQELTGQSRLRAITEARQIAIYLMRKNADMTLKAIGQIFSRDHSTVIYTIQKVEDVLETDRAFKSKYNGIIERI